MSADGVISQYDRNVVFLIMGRFYISSKYRLDTKIEGSTVFINPRALGCSVPSKVRALLRARGFINTIDPIGRGMYVTHL